MAKYSDGDIVTYYFVIVEDDNSRQIKGWTDDKDLAECYLEFHKCKRFSLKSRTDSIENMVKIMEENNNDEINIRCVSVRDTKHKDRTKEVYVPMTETEAMLVREECAVLLSTVVNYGFIDSAIPYMKKKYQSIMKSVLLIDAIKHTVHNQHRKVFEEIDMDQMMVLYHLMPDDFGI